MHLRFEHDNRWRKSSRGKPSNFDQTAQDSSWPFPIQTAVQKVLDRTADHSSEYANSAKPHSDLNYLKLFGWYRQRGRHHSLHTWLGFYAESNKLFDRMILSWRSSKNLDEELHNDCLNCSITCSYLWNLLVSSWKSQIFLQARLWFLESEIKLQCAEAMNSRVLCTPSACIHMLYREALRRSNILNAWIRQTNNKDQSPWRNLAEFCGYGESFLSACRTSQLRLRKSSLKYRVSPSSVRATLVISTAVFFRVLFFQKPRSRCNKIEFHFDGIQGLFACDQSSGRVLTFCVIVYEKIPYLGQ